MKEWLSAAVLGGLLGCAVATPRPMVGGPCSYASVRGWAHITEIQPGAEGARVSFRFEVEDQRAIIKFGGLQGTESFPAEADNSQRVRIGGRLVGVGDRVACVREEIERGTCTPVIYRFPN